MPKILKTFAECSESYKVIVCDDGSVDNTKALLEEYAKKMPLEIITHKVNRGLGETSRDLFERSAELAEKGHVLPGDHG